MTDIYADAWSAARSLAHSLDNGQQFPVVNAGMALGHGEVAHAELPVRSWWFGAVDAVYEHQFFAFGGPILFGVTAVASAVGNSRRKAQAAALATPQWRMIGGHVLVTDHRIVFGGGPADTSIWHPEVAQVAPDLASWRVGITADGHPPYSLDGPWAPYLAVLLVYMHYGDALILPERPPALPGPPPPPVPRPRRRWRRAE